MSFNVFAHFDELVFTNEDGGLAFGMPRREFVHLPDGQDIPSAVPGEPWTVTHWLKADGTYHQITPEQDFAQNLWLHFAYGVDLTSHAPGAAAIIAADEAIYGPHWTITADALLHAINTMPTNLASVLSQYTAQQIVDYAVYEAPNVVLVGQPVDA